MPKINYSHTDATAEITVTVKPDDVMNIGGAIAIGVSREHAREFVAQYHEELAEIAVTAIRTAIEQKLSA